MWIREYVTGRRERGERREDEKGYVRVGSIGTSKKLLGKREEEQPRIEACDGHSHGCYWPIYYHHPTVANTVPNGGLRSSDHLFMLVGAISHNLIQRSAWPSLDAVSAISQRRSCATTNAKFVSVDLGTYSTRFLCCDASQPRAPPKTPNAFLRGSPQSRAPNRPPPSTTPPLSKDSTTIIHPLLFRSTTPLSNWFLSFFASFAPYVATIPTSQSQRGIASSRLRVAPRKGPSLTGVTRPPPPRRLPCPPHPPH